MLVSRESPGTRTSQFVRDVFSQVKAKNPAEPEFHQAVEEVLESLSLVIDRKPEYSQTDKFSHE